MKKILLTTLAVASCAALLAQNVGVDVPNPQEKLDVAGRIHLSTDNSVGVPAGGVGTIRWNGTANAFQGYVGAPVNDWVSFGSPAGLLSETLNNGHIFVGNGSNIATGVAMSGDATITNAGALTIGTGAVTTGKIFNGTILNEDIDAAAAIARSKLASGTPYALVVNNASGVMTGVAPGTSGNVLTSDGTQWQSADPGTLFIRNQMAISQPTANFRISGRGIVGNGAAATPSYSFEGSQTTGIFRPAADAVGISTDGAERVRVSAAGNVGIGITGNATELLQLNGNMLFSRGASRVISVQDALTSTNASGLTVQAGNSLNDSQASTGGSLVLSAGTGNRSLSKGGGDLRLRSGANYKDNDGGDIILETGGANNVLTERMRISESGVFTLPTLNATPDTRLLTISNTGVLGTAVVSGGTVTNVTGTAPIAVANNSTNPAISLNDGGVTNVKLADMTQAHLKGRADGAGTGVPQDLTADQVRTILNVADGATANTGTVTSVGLTMPTGFSVGSSPVTSSGTIAVTSSLANGLPVYTTAGGFTTTAPSSGNLGYWGRSGSDLTMVNSGDNVGIGIVPASKLHVNGGVTAEDNISIGGTGNRIIDFTNSGYGMLRTVGSATNLFLRSSSNAVYLDAENGIISFRTAGFTERMRVTNAGTVLVNNGLSVSGGATVAGGVVVSNGGINVTGDANFNNAVKIIDAQFWLTDGTDNNISSGINTFSGGELLTLRPNGRVSRMPMQTTGPHSKTDSSWETIASTSGNNICFLVSAQGNASCEQRINGSNIQVRNAYAAGTCTWRCIEW